VIASFMGAPQPQGQQPEPIRCPKCSTPQPWVRFDFARVYTERTGRRPPAGTAAWCWAAPKLNPCASCTPQTEEEALAERERETWRLLSIAEVPDAYRGFRLDPKQMARQHPGETVGQFQVRARAEQRFGATDENYAAIQGVRGWLNSNGRKLPTRWLVLWGPPGTGKTALLAAIAERMLAVKPMELVQLEPDQVTFRPKTQDQWDYAYAAGLMSAWTKRTPPRVTYRVASDFVQQCWDRNKEDRYHGDVVGWHAKRQVLLFDELAMVGPGQKELRADEVQNVSRLLLARADHRRLTVIATNREIRELVEKGKNLFGDAVADRLRAAAHVRLGGPSWR
jgi:DNA replication protein DnaC